MPLSALLRLSFSPRQGKEGETFHAGSFLFFPLSFSFFLSLSGWPGFLHLDGLRLVDISGEDGEMDRWIDGGKGSISRGRTNSDASETQARKSIRSFVEILFFSYEQVR